MESALNRAHQQERKAEILLQSRKFDDAIICHQNTVELLQEAMKLTNDDRALESIRLQHDYHIRRQEIIKYKKALFEKRSTLIRHMLKMASLTGGAAGQLATYKSKSSGTEDLQLAIYRNIQENDSLLQFLRNGGTNTDDLFQDVVKLAVKTPKDDKTIIEELQINNQELRHLVSNLVAELEESRSENDRLKMRMEEMRQRIEEYEAERKSKLRVITDSSSPFVFSPSGELSPIGIQNLPPLAPLEMPSFDFNHLERTPSTDENSERSQTSSS